MATIGYYICIPFAWLLRVFYSFTSNYGFAIILFTLAIKLILLPLQIKSKKSMIRMNRMSGKMQEIQKKYANNQAKMNEEMQKLYAEEGANPMSGCLWSFLPLPILIALYSIIRQPITHFMMLPKATLAELVNKVYAAGVDMSNICNLADGALKLDSAGFPQMTAYGQINLIRTITSQYPDFVDGLDGWINVNYNFLGLDLSNQPWNAFTSFHFSWAVIGLILIPILSGLMQLALSMYTMKTNSSNQANAQMKSMMYMMPIMSIYIAFIMPAALGIYWIAQSGFSLIQEVILGKFFNKKIEEEENAKYEARVAERKKRQEEGRRMQEEIRTAEPAPKPTLKEKQKAAREAKALKRAQAPKTSDAGRVGSRPYARGRAYREDRYSDES